MTIIATSTATPTRPTLAGTISIFRAMQDNVDKLKMSDGNDHLDPTEEGIAKEVLTAMTTAAVAAETTINTAGSTILDAHTEISPPRADAIWGALFTDGRDGKSFYARVEARLMKQQCPSRVPTRSVRPTLAGTISIFRAMQDNVDKLKMSDGNDHLDPTEEGIAKEVLTAMTTAAVAAETTINTAGSTILGAHTEISPPRADAIWGALFTNGRDGKSFYARVEARLMKQQCPAVGTRPTLAGMLVAQVSAGYSGPVNHDPYISAALAANLPSDLTARVGLNPTLVGPHGLLAESGKYELTLDAKVIEYSQASLLTTENRQFTFGPFGARGKWKPLPWLQPYTAFDVTHTRRTLENPRLFYENGSEIQWQLELGSDLEKGIWKSTLLYGRGQWLNFDHQFNNINTDSTLDPDDRYKIEDQEVLYSLGHRTIIYLSKRAANGRDQYWTPDLIFDANLSLAGHTFLPQGEEVVDRFFSMPENRMFKQEAGWQRQNVAAALEGFGPTSPFVRFSREKVENYPAETWLSAGARLAISHLTLTPSFERYKINPRDPVTATGGRLRISSSKLLNDALYFDAYGFDLDSGPTAQNTYGGGVGFDVAKFLSPPVKKK